jgi:amino acid adenylation domain-containing protein/thioester reductase-like protein
MLCNPQNTSIHQLIEFQASQTPEAVAVIFQDQQLTYRELNQKANQLANYLITLGVKPEVLVGICLERSLEMVIAMLGVLKAGGAYIPLDPSYPQDRLAIIIEDTQLSILVTQKDLQRHLPQHQAESIYIDIDWLAISQHTTANPVSEVKSENLAYVIYTSGSTGKPKGVAIEHRNTIALINWAREFFTPEQLKGVLASTSICFDLSVFELFVTLSCGGKVILAENALQLPNLPAASEVTLINTVPSAIAALLRMKGIPTSVNTINLAGEPLQNALVQKLYELNHIQQVFNLYGPTEDTTYSTVALVEKGATEIPSIGRPISNTQIYLLETATASQQEQLKPVAVGNPGEIYIGGAGLARGYLHHPDLTAQKFILLPDSLQASSPREHSKKTTHNNQLRERLYKTGDVGVYLPDGNLKFLGRLDHQVKIRGFRVELAEIEAVLSQHPAVRENVVIAKEDAFGSNNLVAYIVPKTHSDKFESSIPVEQTYIKQLQQWQNVWNATYSYSSDDDDPTFNIIGWNDSTTHQPIPDHEMHEWMNCAVERIISLRPQRVLDIGCGNGLLLFRIAPHCSHYCGMDISAEAIHYIEQQLQNNEQDWSHVKVFQGAAHELAEFKPASFDTVILNSVIQYFPSVDYLVQVIEKIVNLVKPGGKIFIGDVRSLPLLEVFHTSVQLNQAIHSLSSHQLQQRIRERIIHDRELVLHPDFFMALKQRIPQISHVQSLLKRGQSNNEMIRFRSDVILHIKTKVSLNSEFLCWDWQQQHLSLPKICQFLRQNQPQTLKITNIPDERILSEVKAVELLTGPDKPQTVGEILETLHSVNELTGVHPEDFWNISQDLSYSVDITWSECRTPGMYDVVLQRQLKTTNQEQILSLPKPSLEWKPLSAYANNPLQVNEKINLVPHLRTFLKEKLPEYMIPSAFVVMENLPLTPTGKIDRRSLPEPKKDRPILTQTYIPPSTLLEKQLAKIWSELLSIEQIGIYDNFFELGGHSLLTTQMLVELEEVIQIQLPLLEFLKESTITGLIKAIDVIQRFDSGTFIEEETQQVKWQDEAVLDPNIQPTVTYLESTEEPQHIFLTGATGFLGAFLLQELLQQTTADICCLVRASNLAAGRQKIQTNLERYMIGNGDLNSRVIPILGDLSQPSLGLTDAKFSELADKLDLIYHAGAFVNLVYPYSALRSANVLGTQEIVRLASQGKITPIHFISTIDVLKPLIFLENRVIKEDENLDYGEGLTRGYTQTKWVGEQLLMAAHSRGIPVCIYRPGMLTGHSQTGASQINDLMCRIIKGIIQIGSAPDLKQWVNMTPIDYASKAIVHLSKQRESLGKTFHIVNPHALPWKKFVSEISNFGYSVQLLPHKKWQAELLKLDSYQDNALMPMLSLFTEKNSQTQMTYLETFLMTSQAFDCQNTLNGLTGTAIVCPPIDAKLISIYLYYLIMSGGIKLPTEYPQQKKTAAKPILGTTIESDKHQKDDTADFSHENKNSDQFTFSYVKH